MTTSHRKSVLSEIEGDEPLSVSALAYLTQRVRNAFYDYVMTKFAEAERDGLTKADLCRRTRIRPEVMSRHLASPGNWTLETAAKLLIGICREELRPSSVSYLARVPRNYRELDCLFSAEDEADILIVHNDDRLSENENTGSDAGEVWPVDQPSQLMSLQ